MSNATPSARLKDITFSIVSHGHGALVEQLLIDLNNLAAATRPVVILTLNLPGEKIDIQPFDRLDIKLIINKESQGFGANHNQAFSHVTTYAFAVLNPDLRIASDVFSAMLQTLEDDRDVGLVAPQVLSPSGEVEDSVRGNLTPISLIARAMSKRAGFAADKTPSNQFFWLAGMAMVFRSEAYQQVKGFDERFFLYCEDYDICVRLRLAGWQLRFLDEFNVVHDAQRDSHRSWRHLRWHLTSLAKVWTSRAFWLLLWRR